ncbi:uncharacterized protein Tco_0419239 [Tanacetum coccineum]
MKAAVLWTINDFPARSSLSGWSGQGYYACPTCNEDTPSMVVKSKIVYVGHRRFLRTKHPLRSKFKEFYGNPEPKPKPRKFTKMDIQLQISKVFKRFPRKHPDIAKKNPKPNRQIELNWSKRSIFWDLEYWPFLLLKNNLDVMHIEKNALEALLNTLLQNDKSKDTLKARQDLETLRVRKEKRFCNFIKGVRLPDGFGSNFKQKVTADDNNITGMKSHDCHIMMHRLLPYEVQQYLPKSIAAPIIEFCLFFKQLCARTLMQQDMAKAKKQSISIMIELEKIFPPAFFDIMIHVAIHLPDEAILGGPLRYRWMFPFERYMKKLKNYVRNKAKPEGSIAEGYVAEEALTFCSRYLKDDVETRFNRLGRNDDGLPEEEPNKFQIREKKKVKMGCSEELFSLACGPISACTYPACIVNGVKFVVHEGDILPYHSMQRSFNTRLDGGAEMFMGQLEEIMELTVYRRRLARNTWLEVSDTCLSSEMWKSPDQDVILMACLAPRSHGGDAGGSPPRQPNRPVPAQCQRDYASMLNSLMGETIRPLPLACEWEEIPEAFKAHIFPTLESYFNLAEWYNNQDKVVVGKNVYTVGERGRLGRNLNWRLLWRKNKNRIKAQQYTIYDSPDEAKNHLPPSTVWGERTHDEWNELVDWFSHPNQVSRSMKNAANRAKNTIPTHQGKKSFAQGRNEYSRKASRGPHLTWRRRTQTQRLANLNTKKTSRDTRANQAFADVMTREQMTQILRQKEQENELLRKQAEEAQQRAYLAALKADSADQRASAAYQNTETMYGAVDNATEDNNEEEDEQQSGGDYSSDEEAEYEEEE